MFDTNGVLFEYDLSGDSPSLIAKKELVDECCALGLSMDPLGTEVVVGSDEFSEAQRFSLPDLTPLPGYPVSPWTTASFSPDGQYVAGVGISGTPEIRVFPKGSAEPVSEFDLVPGAPRGLETLAITPDGQKLFATAWDCCQVWFHIVDAPTEPLPPPELSIAVDQDPIPVGYPFLLSSHLEFPEGPAAGETVRFFMNEQEIGSAITDENGDALLEPIPPQGGGDRTFQSYWPGDPEHRSGASAPLVVAFAMFASSLTIDISPEPALVGEEVTISGTLSMDPPGDPSNQTIHVARRVPEGPIIPVGDVLTQPDGTYSISDQPPDAGTFEYQVTWDGDSGHQPAYVSDSVLVRSQSVGDDFNGDGYADLASGIVGEDVGGLEDAGAVSVIYGSSTGLTDIGNQFWTQDSAGIQDSVEASDFFGYAVAAGDFNADGFGDLAIGAADDDVGTLVDGGVVNVLYGSAAGLHLDRQPALVAGQHGNPGLRRGVRLLRHLSGHRGPQR